jgi:hypothetical protein
MREFDIGILSLMCDVLSVYVVLSHPGISLLSLCLGDFTSSTTGKQVIYFQQTDEPWTPGTLQLW